MQRHGTFALTLFDAFVICHGFKKKSNIRLNCSIFVNIFFFQSYLKNYLFSKYNIWRIDIFSLLPQESPSWNLGTRFDSERMSSLYKHVKSCLSMKNINFLLISNSKFFIFYYIMADNAWAWYLLIILDFIGLLLLKKCLSNDYAKVSLSYFCAGVLRDKSAISLTIVIFEK